jgi:hypothetical protein
MLLTSLVAGAPAAHAYTTRDAIVAQAVSQLGVRGDANKCQPYGPCEEWCALFANWVWRNAGVNPVPTTATGRGEGKWGLDHGLFKARPSGQMGDPLPGDMVVFGTPVDAVGGHVAIVESVNNNGTITTINGNFDNAVKRWTINPNTATAGSDNYHVSGYVTPPGVQGVPVSWSGGRVVVGRNGADHVFVRGQDGEIWTLAQSGDHVPFQSIAPIAGDFPVGAKPYAVIEHNGAAAVFARGQDHQIWWVQQAGENGGWQSLSPIAGDFPDDANPTAVVLHNGAIAVFARGRDGRMWWVQQDGDHGPWQALAPIAGDFPAGTQISPVVLNNGAIALFARGQDHEIWWIQQSGDHGPWQVLAPIAGALPLS